MKKIYLLTVLVSGFLFLTTQSAIAQTEIPVASFDENMVLTIPTDAELSPVYTVDISNMGFKDAAAADRFFRSMTDNLVNAKVDYAAQTATVHLMLQYAPTPDWGVAKWNTYFTSVSSRYLGAYNKFNE
ncbi:MAG: hypothetical protein IPG60_08385 [Bacteroidetes bacterium]|nr:hypothetical protein [Bacteroidota bacterium]MBP7399123.1 hypothetical protein [Chitinophagales bacterium]MBK7110757.1 hypothetical protein [Bacteroidota bacterium]MBK8488023.1 hypothetical protein [Bacteroidota bacterium]MBK8682219.1 hypothetical protein [Bacteroidota bacterium]